MVRDLNLNDLRVLECDAKFPLPTFDLLFPIRKSIEVDGELIASFWVKLTSEVSLIFNSCSSKFNHARALEEIDKFLIFEGRKLGLNDVHLFIKDDFNFERLLKRKFNFEEVIGQALYKRF